MKKAISVVILFVSLTLQAQFVRAETEKCFLGESRPIFAEGEKYYRTELFFGRSIPGGGLVSVEQWSQFLVEIVTPRFPDGFTILSGSGQYRDKSGKIISEPSKVLVFLYSRKALKESRAKIEEIRSAYVKKFDQESVLRVDFKSSVEVSF